MRREFVGDEYENCIKCRKVVAGFRAGWESFW